MSGLKNVVKTGWHPSGKDGKKESWRGDFKGVDSVAGWIGKGKGGAAQEHRDHQSTPLSNLKDPASFGPPPKNVQYHGGTAEPSAASSSTGGLGSAIPQSQLQAEQEAVASRAQAAAMEEAKATATAVPYQSNTTGINTDNLPKPPQRDAAAGRDNTQPSKPSLPPRLPPRQSSPTSPTKPPLPFPGRDARSQAGPKDGYLNQGALGRLGKAGISVPGLEVGPKTPPDVSQPERATSPSQRPLLSAASIPRPSEMNSRFSKLSLASPSPAAADNGTSFAEKQAAIRTASSFQKDPSSISLSEAKSAAATANNFRARHGEQVSQGWKTASGVNEKYGIINKANQYASSASLPSNVDVPRSPDPTTSSTKKKAPPPPPKKKGLTSSTEGADAPPPVPVASKPR